MNCDCYLSFYGYSNFKRVIAASTPTLPVFGTVSASDIDGKQFIELPNKTLANLILQNCYCLAMGIAWLANLVDTCKTPKAFYALIQSIYIEQRFEEGKVDSERAFPKTFSSSDEKVVHLQENLLGSPNDIEPFVNKNKAGIFIFYLYFKTQTDNCAHAISYRYDHRSSKYMLFNPSPRYGVLKILTNKDAIITYLIDFLQEENSPDLNTVCIKTMTVQRQKFKLLSS